MRRRKSSWPVLSKLLAGLLCVATWSGCGDGKPQADPKTRRLRGLSRLLSQGTMVERRRAARALGALGDPRAVPPLATALEDASPAVRMTAADALVGFGPKAREPLLAALAGKEPTAREAAAYGLGRLRCAAAADVLIEATAFHRDEYAGQFIRAAAARALGPIGDRKAIAALAACTKDGENGEVRRAAASALGTLRDPRSVEPLKELIRTESGRLERLLAELADQGKLTQEGRMVRGKPMTNREKGAILTHRSVRSAAEIALEKLAAPAATTRAGR